MIEAGVDLQQVQKILGHASLITTVKYTHLTTKTSSRARTHINHLMDGFNVTWGKVK